LRDRFNVEAVWYRDRTGNQLVPFPTPLFTGFANVIENSPALVQNTGWEYTVSAVLIKTSKVVWSINFNTAINQNKLVAYPNFSQSPYTNTFKIGEPLNIQYALHYIGVDPQTGQYSFLDKNHDGDIVVAIPPGTPPDDRYIVKLAPRFFGGMGINLSYGALNANLFFNIKDQIGQNAFETVLSPPGYANTNQPASIFGKQWQAPGDIASVQEFTTNSPISFNNFKQSDGAYTDASFVRLSNLSVSYSLSGRYLKNAGLSGCAIFFHANNLFIITKYKGLDPETQNFGGLPPTKTIVGGIKLDF